MLLLLVFLADFRVSNYSKAYHSNDISDIETFEVGVVLGTSKWVRTGQKNLYFTYRIQAAAKLYKSGKIKKILVSGDNGTKYYNEPKDMRDALVAEGIPIDDIILDYAGFRTLDSVLRAQKVFGYNRFLIISQQFHNERAIFLARKNDIDAFGFNAKDVDTFRGIKTKFREYLARVKVFYDLWFGVKPKYY